MSGRLNGTNVFFLIDTAASYSLICDCLVYRNCAIRNKWPQRMVQSTKSYRPKWLAKKAQMRGLVQISFLPSIHLLVDTWDSHNSGLTAAPNWHKQIALCISELTICAFQMFRKYQLFYIGIRSEQRKCRPIPAIILPLHLLSSLISADNCLFLKQKFLMAPLFDGAQKRFFKNKSILRIITPLQIISSDFVTSAVTCQAFYC